MGGPVRGDKPGSRRKPKKGYVMSDTSVIRNTKLEDSGPERQAEQ